jgi:hypothetical protein
MEGQANRYHVETTEGTVSSPRLSVDHPAFELIGSRLFTCEHCHETVTLLQIVKGQHGCLQREYLGTNFGPPPW